MFNTWERKVKRSINAVTIVRFSNIDAHSENLRKVKKGDVIYVPVGTVHGVGAGTLIAEIQESSNVTYRVYDYNRKDKNGKTRELHFDKALEVMDLSSSKEVKQQARMVRYYPGSSREILCRCKYFITEKLTIKTGCSFSIYENSFQVLLCLDGDGQIEIADKPGKSLRFRKGECMFLPAGLGRCFVLGDTTLLKIRC
ncbi:MAG: hypothetical protein R3Y24_09215 [Eubacteriales bacterium]